MWGSVWIAYRGYRTTSPLPQPLTAAAVVAVVVEGNIGRGDPPHPPGGRYVFCCVMLCYDTMGMLGR